MLRQASGGPSYEVLALRYATCLSTRSRCFWEYARYGEPDAPQRMDFYLWVVRNAERTIVIDTGFDPAVGARRERTCLSDPALALSLAGVEPASVEHVVLTHLHYDHIGNLGAFPRARFDAQERELDFWGATDARDPRAGAFVEPLELAAVEAAARAGRVRRIDGDAELAPGVVALWTGGHTPGQMIVLVQGVRSLVVLASDSLHFYEELDRDRPFAVVSSLPEMHAAYALLRRLAAHGATIVAGHDPAVLERFPRLPGRAREIAASFG